MKLVEMTVNTYIDTVASDAPAPGGGSASALCGAQGAGLATMVAGLTIGKKKYVEFNDACIEIRDNGGNNSQIKNGVLTFCVKAGATVTVNGYPSYTSYTFGDGTTTTAEITEATYTYTATEDVMITITPVSGNNYFYSIVITY